MNTANGAALSGASALTDVLAVMGEADAMAIVTEVNIELAESMARINAAGEPTRQGDSAHDSFLELVIYGNKVAAVADFLHKFYDSGSGVIRVSLDPLVTERAMREVFRYDLAESMKEALFACRAGYFVNRDGQWLNHRGDLFVMSNE